VLVTFPPVTFGGDAGYTLTLFGSTLVPRVFAFRLSVLGWILGSLREKRKKMAAREARAARRGTVAALNPDNHPQDNQPHHHQAPAQRLIGDIVREENRVRRKEREPPLFRGEAHEDAVDWLLR